MTTTPSFRVRALSPEVPAAVRATGRDASGLPPHRSTAAGGEPLRCCLRDAATGEEIMLFGYAPPIPSGPYREVGPVFAHAGPCAGPAPGYPPAWRGRAQVLRAYDRRGWIHDARVHDGADPEAVIAELLADPAVRRLHSRNVAYGCFMFTVDRPG
ncbi:DUF1203 domain-containing protein [Micromonospora sp. NBC_01405]|uniref:DUF1203 domain-containing protein n=1 Tax=Micromonospora sp. NBC_01405 TaxID=2903589 RepID=UPI0032431756